MKVMKKIEEWFWEKIFGRRDVGNVNWNNENIEKIIILEKIVEQTRCEKRIKKRKCGINNFENVKNCWRQYHTFY